MTVYLSANAKKVMTIICCESSEELCEGIRTSRNCGIVNSCTLVLFQLLSSLFAIKDVQINLRVTDIFIELLADYFPFSKLNCCFLFISNNIKLYCLFFVFFSVLYPMFGL